jgi:hypothetical protein
MRIELTPEEARVLAEVLSRAGEAEQGVLWNIRADLDQQLAVQQRSRPMSKAAKLAIIALTLLPLIYFFLFLGSVGYLFSTRPKSPGGLFAHPLAFFIIHFGMMLFMFALLVFYVVFIVRTTRRRDMKVVWAVAVFMGGPFFMPFFWYLFIWRDDPAALST